MPLLEPEFKDGMRFLLTNETASSQFGVLRPSWDSGDAQKTWFSRFLMSL
jgi:hypothetical protein